jgi:hypothetical protein
MQLSFSFFVKTVLKKLSTLNVVLKYNPAQFLIDN